MLRDTCGPGGKGRPAGPQTQNAAGKTPWLNSQSQTNAGTRQASLDKGREWAPLWTGRELMRVLAPKGGKDRELSEGSPLGTIQERTQ